VIFSESFSGRTPGFGPGNGGSNPPSESFRIDKQRREKYTRRYTQSRGDHPSGAGIRYTLDSLSKIVHNPTTMGLHALDLHTKSMNLVDFRFNNFRGSFMLEFLE
jgi:hypothetical protein